MQQIREYAISIGCKFTFILIFLFIVLTKVHCSCENKTLENGDIDIVGKNTYRIYCKRGYRKNNPKINEVKCSGQFPTVYCIKIECKIGMSLGNGTITPIGPIEPGQNFSVKCNNGYQLHGSDIISCINDTTLKPNVMPYCLFILSSEKSSGFNYSNICIISASVLVVIAILLSVFLTYCCVKKNNSKNNSVNTDPVDTVQYTTYLPQEPKSVGDTRAYRKYSITRTRK